MGRFLTQDTWDGNPNLPMSYNHWNYVDGNPINRLDPSGYCYLDDLSKECVPYAPPASLPNTNGYDEKVHPKSISWVSNSMANNINSQLAPIYNTDGNLVSNINAAQFQIGGYEKYTGNCSEWSSGKKKDRVCLRYESFNVNFCGQVVLSAILGQLVPGLTARDIVEDLNYQSGTSASLLASYLNDKYSRYVKADSVVMSPNVRTGQQFHNYMSGLFAQSALLAPIVNIVSGNSYPPGDPDGLNGQLGIIGGINHWILITGVSRQWKNQEDSPLNWVRVFNPFDNQTEYYWWPDFKAAWGKPSSNYVSLKIEILK
jgi:hypothetical protein